MQPVCIRGVLVSSRRQRPAPQSSIPSFASATIRSVCEFAIAEAERGYEFPWT